MAEPTLIAPCPFCGQEPSLANDKGDIYVHCQFCGARGPCLLDSKVDAISAWNHGHPKPPAVDPIAALERHSLPGGWREHDGHLDPPIDGNTFVQVRFRDGDESHCGKMHDWDQNWQWATLGEHDGDIVAYRPLYASPPPPSVWFSIDTAPKDGRHVILRIEHPNYAVATGPEQHRWEDFAPAYWTDFNHGGWVWNGMLGTPTHWAPHPVPRLGDALPPPPQKEGK